MKGQAELTSRMDIRLRSHILTHPNLLYAEFVSEEIKATL